MPAIHAMVILPNSWSGAAQDSVVNTWNFSCSSGPVSGHYTAMMSALTAFYTAVPAGQTAGLKTYLGESLSRAASAVQVKAWDSTSNLDGTAMGSPDFASAFTLAAATASTTPLPEECAVALTLEGDGRAGAAVEGIGTSRPKQRRTGRLFLGSLQSNIVYPDSEGAGAQVHPTAVAGILASVGVLRDTLAAYQAGFKLGVWSRANATIYPLEAVSMDNRFDTIRSRGLKTGLRTRVLL